MSLDHLNIIYTLIHYNLCEKKKSFLSSSQRRYKPHAKSRVTFSDITNTQVSLGTHVIWIGIVFEALASKQFDKHVTTVDMGDRFGGKKGTHTFSPVERCQRKIMTCPLFRPTTDHMLNI